MSSLAEQIRVLRDWVKEHTPLAYGKEKPEPAVAVQHKNTDLNEDAAEIGRKLLAAAMADRVAYEPAPDAGVQLHKDALREAPPNPEAVDKNDAPLYHLDSHQARYMLEVLSPYSPSILTQSEGHGLGLAGHELKSCIFPQTPLSRFNDKLKKQLGLDGQLLYRKLSFELDAARNNPELYNTSTPVVQKIQRGVQVYAEGRTADALTILETIRNEDPHNKLVSYVLSNIFYHRAAHGHRKFLPQAREEGKKAATGIDKIKPEITNRFRYNYIALDGYFGLERQIEIIRDFGFFNAIPAEDAPEVEHAHYIKSMVYLSLTNPDEWSNVEIEAITQMAESYIGGGLLFALFFEKKCLPAIFSDNADITAHFEPLQHILHALQLLQYHLNNYKQTIAEHFAENIEQTPPEYWTIHRRLMVLAAKNLPTPDLFMFLANTTLDGKHYTPTENLDRLLREAELQLGDYWACWIHKINQYAQFYAPLTLPDALAVKEQGVLPKVLLALDELRREEKKLIDTDKWSLSSHYQPKYTYESLAEIGIGHAFTLMSFTPKVPTLKNHYQMWGAVMPSALLPSDIIEGRAKAGGFASIQEIAAALDGAHKILTDPEYGMAAQQKKAWQTYLKMQSQAENSKHGNGRFNELLAEIWWFLLLVVPGALVAFTMVAASNSLQSGVRIFIMVLATAVLLGGGALVLQRSKQMNLKNRQTRQGGSANHRAEPHAETHPDDDDDVSLQDLAGKN